MLDKIQNRLDKEIDKIINKEDLTIADYLFLESVCEKKYLNSNREHINNLTNSLWENICNSTKKGVEPWQETSLA